MYRAFSWAKEEGIIAENPLRGMKCPKARTRERALSNGEYLLLMRNSQRDFTQWEVMPENWIRTVPQTGTA